MAFCTITPIKSRCWNENMERSVIGELIAGSGDERRRQVPFLPGRRRRRPRGLEETGRESGRRSALLFPIINPIIREK